MNKNESAALILEQISKLLDLAGEETWLEQVTDARQRLVSPSSTTQAAGFDLVRDFFGGMGSLSDLVFSREAKNVPTGYSISEANGLFRRQMRLLHEELEADVASTKDGLHRRLEQAELDSKLPDETPADESQTNRLTYYRLRKRSTSQALGGLALSVTALGSLLVYLRAYAILGIPLDEFSPINYRVLVGTAFVSLFSLVSGSLIAITVLFGIRASSGIIATRVIAWLTLLLSALALIAFGGFVSVVL